MVLFYSLAKIIKIGMENHFIRIYLISFWINRSESDIIGALPNAFLLFMPTKLLILRFDSPRWIVRWGGASSYSFFLTWKCLHWSRHANRRHPRRGAACLDSLQENQWTPEPSAIEFPVLSLPPVSREPHSYRMPIAPSSSLKKRPSSSCATCF
jgi:hypothetical protein